LEEFDGIEDEETGTRNHDYEPERYWQDALSGLADDAVPTDDDELFQLWMDLGRPEPDDPGLIQGVTDIKRIVQVSVYCKAWELLYDIAHEFELD
jgi:hypothetical protein